MQKIIEKVRNVLVRTDGIYEMLCKNNTNSAMKAINQIMPELNEIIMKLISEIPYYRKQGVDLPEDVILAQLQNLLEAFEHSDIVMLADTLKYELTATLKVYEEILVQLEAGS